MGFVMHRTYCGAQVLTSTRSRASRERQRIVHADPGELRWPKWRNVPSAQRRTSFVSRAIRVVVSSVLRSRNAARATTTRAGVPALPSIEPRFRDGVCLTGLNAFSSFPSFELGTAGGSGRPFLLPRNASAHP